MGSFFGNAIIPFAVSYAAKNKGMSAMKKGVDFFVVIWYNAM